MIKIAIASGKGGTGKTMIATGLASVLVREITLQFLDCDVEAPNAHLFLRPEIHETHPAIIALPVIDPDVCTLCGRCVDVCEFNALAKIGGQILIFPQLCHGCGSCNLQCPESAIREKPHPIGTLSLGQTESGIQYGRGELTISEPMPAPIIRQLKRKMQNHGEIRILDAPPGASCSVVATLHDADFVLLVTEPTPFGLHDLRQMLGVLEQTRTPAGVIINRDGIGGKVDKGRTGITSDVEILLENRNIPILMRIPHRCEIAAGLAKGKVLTEILPQYRMEFSNLYLKILEQLQTQRTAA